jgi:hypothetical protein
MKFSLDESQAEQFIKQDNITDEYSVPVMEESVRSGFIQRLAHALRLLLKKEVNHNSPYH